MYAAQVFCHCTTLSQPFLFLLNGTFLSDLESQRAFSKASLTKVCPNLKSCWEFSKTAEWDWDSSKAW